MPSCLNVAIPPGVNATSFAVIVFALISLATIERAANTPVDKVAELAPIGKIVGDS